MEYIDLAITASITMLAFGLFTLSVVNYYKRRNSRLLFLSVVFLVFLIKEVLISFRLFDYRVPIVDTTLNLWLFDILILVLLYIGTIKR
jgi:hypothetical protein